MSCIYFIPQIQTVAGTWISAGEACSTYEEAESQLKEFENSERVLGTRIIQSSCKEISLKNRCC